MRLVVVLFGATARAFCEIDKQGAEGHAVWGAGAGAALGCYMGSMLVYLCVCVCVFCFFPRATCLAIFMGNN